MSRNINRNHSSILRDFNVGLLDPCDLTLTFYQLSPFQFQLILLITQTEVLAVPGCLKSVRMLRRVQGVNPEIWMKGTSAAPVYWEHLVTAIVIGH